MSDAQLSYELRDSTAVLKMDDGKANAVSHDLIKALHEALDRAENEASAVVIVGREGKFSAGFDMSVMTGGPDAVRGLVTAGAELLLRLYMFPRPVVAACSGHALAAGAIMLLVSDVRIGARGPFKIGLNEVAISMTLPIFGVELARERLAKSHYTRSVTQATIYDADGAAQAGYLDQVVEAADLEATALKEAARLGALPRTAFAGTKRNERQDTEARIRATLAEDMARIGAPA